MPARSLGQLTVELQAEVSAFRTDLARVEKNLQTTSKRMKKSVGNVSRAFKTMIPVLSFAALGRMVSSSLNVADSLGKLSTATGISAEAIQKFQFAAEQSGGTTQQLDASLVTFTKRMGELKVGTGALNTQLEKSNPALKEMLINAGSTEEAFRIFTNAIGGTGTEMDAMALASSGVSKANAQLLTVIGTGGTTLDEFGEQLANTGSIMSTETVAGAQAANDALNLLWKSTGDLVTVFLAELGPTITTVANWLAVTLPSAINTAGAFLTDLANNFQIAYNIISNITVSLADFFIDSWNGIRNTMVSFVDNALSTIEGMFRLGEGAIAEAVKGWLNVVVELFSSAWTWIADTTSQFIDNIVYQFGGTSTKWVEPYSNTMEELEEVTAATMVNIESTVVNGMKPIEIAITKGAETTVDIVGKMGVEVCGKVKQTTECVTTSTTEMVNGVLTDYQRMEKETVSTAERMAAQTETSVDEIVSFFEIDLHSIAETFLPGWAGAVLDIFDALGIDVVGVVEDMISEVTGLFGDLGDIIGDIPIVGDVLGGIGDIFGFHEGADFTVKGKPGVDTNIVAFRATAGERVQVTPTGGGPDAVVIELSGIRADLARRDKQITMLLQQLRARPGRQAA